MIKLCDRDDVQKHLEDLQEILTVSNNLAAKMQAADELKKTTRTSQ